jgi:hypothetical protein
LDLFEEYSPKLSYTGSGISVCDISDAVGDVGGSSSVVVVELIDGAHDGVRGLRGIVT